MTTNTAQLLVEGKNDQHVVWALCEAHHIAKTFAVETPREHGGGIDDLLQSIPVRLKISGLHALGIVVDADQNLNTRWQAISQRLVDAGYSALPPDKDGTIINEPGKPKVGIWIMPDNQLPGMLETFTAHLIHPNDLLLPKVNQTLDELEAENLNLYALIHRPKAMIHTWLAWQETPGQPMGQAITSRVLRYNNPLALAFVNWLNRLFQP